MTHFSLKNAILLASVLTFSAGMSAFAAPVKADCATDPLFDTNSCDVCYTEKYDTKITPTGWTAELATVKVPWEHGGGTLSEAILESGQTNPTIIPSADVTVTPTDATQIWEFDTDIVWYELGTLGDREFYIDKGMTKNLYTLKTGVKLSLAGKGTKDTVLIKTNLAYDDYDPAAAETSTGKSRNICILGNLGTGESEAVTPPPAIAPPTTEQSITPPLDAAGPEEEVVITPEQTEPKSGPEFWIFLLLAFVFSGAWTAWKKQKS
ncbi:MAG: hypothetical protein WC753_00720 [Candidatus Gracilibacteria bacterium]